MIDAIRSNRFKPTMVGCVVAVYLVSIAIVAWGRLDMAWDSLAYHLPFAAIRGGVATYSDFIIPAHHVEILEGFPPVLDTIKGWMWRLTGRAEATQLFNLVVVLLGTLLLSKLYRFGMAVALIAILAVPIGQVEFASNYTDLPVNFLLAFALFSSVHAIVRPEAHRCTHGVAAALALCLATTFKVTAIPFGVVIWFVYLASATTFQPQTGASSIAVLRRSNLLHFFGFAVLGALLSAGYGVVNLIKMGNPFFPVPVQVGPISLPGTVPASNWTAAAYLAEAPRVVRWIISVVEWRAFDSRPLPYIVSQGDVPESAMSYRMGGLFAFQLFFSASVLYLVRARIGRSVMARIIALHMVVALVSAFVPGSHEMRYFFFWYLSFLWSIAYVLHVRERDAGYEKIYVASLCCAAVYITMITGARYVYLFDDMPSAERVVGVSIRADLEARLKAGERHICVVDKDPYGFLYSRPFHPKLMSGVHYQVSADSTSEVCVSKSRGEL